MYSVSLTRRPTGTRLNMSLDKTAPVVVERGVDDRRAAGDLDGFRQAADFHLQAGQIDRLSEADGDAALLDGLEALQLSAYV